jgi:hypothetical protein
MYACVLETGRGFFERVRAPSDATAHSYDPPAPPLDTRIDTVRYAVGLFREH